MSDYADIADLSWDNIQEPKVLPVGTYLLKLRNASYQAAKEADKSPVVMFVYVPKEAMADVKVEELSELGADYDISENKVFHRFYIEDGSSWDAVRKHIQKHFSEDKELSGGILETLKGLKGVEVLGYLDQNTFKRKDGSVATGNNITEFARVE